MRSAWASYADNIVTADLDEVGYDLRNPTALRSWLRAYALATATTASYETIRDAATSGHADKPAKTTTIRYVDALRRLWIVDPLEAWLPVANDLTRLNQAPKHLLVDTGLAASLAQVGPAAVALADAEGLPAHARSVSIRLAGDQPELDL